MTKDHDRKALIRERMEKTGESYTAARLHLFGPSPDDIDAVHEETEPAPGDAGSATFSMPDRSATLESAMSSVRAMYENSGARVEDGVLRVWMGEPSTFATKIPLTSIVTAERLPDRADGTSLGVHGFRGKWLVNSAYTGLVRLKLNPAVPATLAPREAMPEAARDKGGPIVKFLTRSRTIRLKELTISVNDPDALIAASRPR